jgi:lipid II:glycine glycyltransferase (peptidoglycan interpeptide bridge formation enzyme)
MTNNLITHINQNQLTDRQLEELFENNTASFFQTPEALSFFNSVGLETFVFAIEFEHKIMAYVSGIIQKESGIKSSFTRRAIIYGGPVISSEAEVDHVTELFKTVIKKLKRKVIYIETRNFNDYSEYKTALDEIGFEYHSHLNFHLKCDTEEQAKERLGKSKLRQIKRSLKEGAELREAQSQFEVEEYYTILNDLYKTKVKTPLPELTFFMSLFNQEVAKFLLVFYKEKVVGGVVCPIFNNEVIYEWYACGKNRTYKNIYPSTLATWGGIVYACNHKIETYDFMGAGKPDEDYGVREFKLKFGGDLVEHGRFIYVTNPFLYSLGKRAVKILKKQ